MGKSIVSILKDRTPPWARAGALQVIRDYGVATSSLRGHPDFLIIGAKRCGTTTLYWHLVQHPWVAPLFPRAKRIKGIHFFDWNFHRGPRWYRSHFPSALYRALGRLQGVARVVAGEASSSYLFHPHAPERARLVVPETRLIVLLRNPVDRAWSHYRARVRKGLEQLSFEEAIQAEPKRLDGERERALADPGYRSYPLEHQAYVSLGLYLHPLQAWMDRFPSRNVLVLAAKDLAADPAGAYRRVLSFLDLPPWIPPRFRPLNVGSGNEEMAPATRATLQERFAPDNERLAEFLRMDLGWDPA